MKDIKNAGVSSKEAVRVVRQRFHSFDKTLLSKATNPEKYGVILHPESERILIDSFPELDDGISKPIPAPVAGKRDYHKLTHKISVRVTETQKALLQQRLSDDGLTAQTFFTTVIEKYNKGELHLAWLQDSRKEKNNDSQSE